MPGRQELRGKQGGLPRLGHHGPLGKWRGAVVEDFQAVVPTVVGRQTQDKPTEGHKISTELGARATSATCLLYDFG